MGCCNERRCSWGIAIIAAAFMVNFIRDGIRLSFGMFFTVFIETFGKDAETTAWIGSLMLSVMNFSAPLSSMLVVKFGSRVSTVLGSLLCFTGFLTSAYVPNMYFLYLSLGVVTGFGICLMYLAQTVIVVQYFKANRTLALGVTVCGSGIWTIIILVRRGIFHVFLTLLTSEYPWSGIMLIVSGIMLEACVAGMLMRPADSNTVINETHSDKDNYKEGNRHRAEYSRTKDIIVEKENEINCPTNKITNVEIQEESTRVRTSEDVAFYRTDNVTENYRHLKSLTNSENHTTVNRSCENHMPGSSESNRSEVSDALLETKSDQQTTLETNNRDKDQAYKQETIHGVYGTLLKDVKVYLLVLSQFFTGSGFMLPFTFIPLTALSLGYSKTDAAWLLTASSISSIVSRLAIGALGDVRGVNRSYLFIGVFVLNAITCLALAFSRNYILLIILCCSYGIGAGSVTILTPVVITDIFGDKRISQVFGLCMFGRGPGNLIGPPIAGLVFDKTGSTLFVFILAALAYFTGTIMLVWCIYLHRREMRTLGRT